MLKLLHRNNQMVSLVALEEIQLPEGTEVLVTPLLDETDFWRRASESSLDAVWDNPEDDVYAQLLAE